MTEPMNPPSTEILQKLDELNSWRVEREQKYGSIEPQLNMLVDDIEAGKFGENAKTGDWYLHVKGIKDSVVKPDISAIKLELNALYDEE